MLLLLAPVLLQAQLPDLNWLAGHWCTEPQGGAVTCETWSGMDKGVMRGAGTTRKAGQVTINESMKILVSESGMFFHAEPKNQKPTNFRMAQFDAKARSVSFEDRSHDYPQRVRYWREGEVLLAEISMLDGSKAVRWTFHRVK